MELIEQVLGIAILFAATFGLIVLSSADGSSSLEERVARGELTQEQYRTILLARVGTL